MPIQAFSFSPVSIQQPAFAGGGQRRRITQLYPDREVLRTPATPVDTADIAGNKDLQQLIDDMIKTMGSRLHAVGIAAPQVGEGVRVFVRRTLKGLGSPQAIINPEITEQSKGKRGMREGCLSVSDQTRYVRRSRQVTLKGFNRKGQPVRYKLRGINARIAQHELDHLNGKLIVDY